MFGKAGSPITASGPMMLLKSLGFDPQAMIGMFQQAQQIVVDFAKQATQHHNMQMEQQQINRDMIMSHLQMIEHDAKVINDGIVIKLELIHASVRALNPDHAGDLGVPVAITGDGVSIGEELSVKIDREHAEKETPEFKAFVEQNYESAYSIVGKGGFTSSAWKGVIGCWLEHRRNERTKRTA